MPQLLSLSRAARLAGISRGELQKRIRKEDAKTFEGKLSVDVLLELYPHIDMETDPVLERVKKIRADAKPKAHYSDGWMPDPEVLMSRLKEFQHTLVQTKSSLNASEALVQETLMNSHPRSMRQMKHCAKPSSKSIKRLGKGHAAHGTGGGCTCCTVRERCLA